MYSTKMKEWLAWRTKEDDRLYELYGKPLEKDHKGEYVAIGPEGQIILGDDGNAVIKQAIDRFGSGNFAITKVGEGAYGKWLSLKR
jgi:hypothetical protein